MQVSDMRTECSCCQQTLVVYWPVQVSDLFTLPQDKKKAMSTDEIVLHVWQS